MPTRSSERMSMSRRGELASSSIIVQPIPKTDSIRDVAKELGFRRIIYPWNKAYKIWWGNSVVWSILTIFFETYQIAFGRAGLYPYDNGVAIFSYLFYVIFFIDIVLNFNLAYYNEDDELVVDRRDIAKNYWSFMFWVDLLGIVPLYFIVLASSGLLGVDNTTTQYLSLLRLFRLVRLHRVAQLFDAMKYSPRVSLMTLTLVRNFGAALVWTHFAACVMYFIAHQYGFDADKTWIGALLEHYGLLTLEDKRDIYQFTFQKYLTSMYWSIVTFTTVGYGDYSPVNPAEQIWAIIYMLLNMILTSWMIGSMTLLIVKNDEATSLYRNTMQTLDQYSKMNNFEKKFKKRLKRQIEIDFKHRKTSDEVVLQDFPSTTRRKVLRRLYLPALKQCRLMKGVRQQFMDAFFRVCKVEIISPDEDIVQRGNIAADLYFLLEGTAKLLTWETDGEEIHDNTFTTTRSGGSAQQQQQLRRNSMTDSEDSQMKLFGLSSGCFRKPELDEGEFINGISFFTETPQSNTIRTFSVCKTLTLPRYAYKSLIEDHPGSLSKILNNLLSKVDELAKEVGVTHVHFADQTLDDTLHTTKTVQEIQAEVEYTAARDAITMHISKQQDDHTTAFLYAASRNDVATLRLMLDQAFNPNSKDFDNRTALMVAAMKGNTECINLLLEHQADPNKLDVHGISALMEAARGGHEDAMNMLLNKGASLCLNERKAALTLCRAVSVGDTLLLKGLLNAKIQVNACDFNQRTASHVAVANGDLEALKLLIEYGADLTLKDKGGNTIYAEAEQGSFTHILQYLNPEECKEEE